MPLRRFVLGSLAAVVLASCGGSASAPKVETVPAPVPAPATTAAPAGEMRVTASALNVRREPSTSADVIAQLRKGDRVLLLSAEIEWSKIQTSDGTVGWVASQHISREAAAAAPARPSRRRRNGCAPDSDFVFIQPPKPSFTESSQKHGLVTVDVNVDASGKIVSARVVENTTGDDALGAAAVAEIRSATFAPPVRNCAAKAFIYTYKRSF